MIVPAVHSLVNKGLQAKELDTQMGVEMKAAMKNDLGKRYQDANVKSFFHVSSPLNPRFKSLAFLSEVEREAAHNNLELKAMQSEDKRAKMQAIKLEKLTVLPTQPLPSLEGGKCNDRSIRCDGEA